MKLVGKSEDFLNLIRRRNVVGIGSERKTSGQKSGGGWPCAQSHFRRITIFHLDVDLLARHRDRDGRPIHSSGEEERLSWTRIPSIRVRIVYSCHLASCHRGYTSPRSSLIGASNSTQPSIRDVPAAIFHARSARVESSAVHATLIVPFFFFFFFSLPRSNCHLDLI